MEKQQVVIYDKELKISNGTYDKIRVIEVIFRHAWKIFYW